ncbi:MAG: hypothetical protein ABR577_00900 [Pyrinomonadaceae bacterium]
MVVENDSPASQDSPEAARERATTLADKLAPVEEQTHMANALAGKEGATGSFKISPAILDEGSTARLLDLHPVVFVIVGFALLFIAFIAYLIAKTPAH